MPLLSRVIRRTLPSLAGALALVALDAVWQTASAQVQERDMSDDSAEGINAVRVENEYKLMVPQGSVERLWKFLVSFRPKPPVSTPVNRPLKADSSTEFFTDVYFDTPDFLLLAGQNGIRHRSRSIPGNRANRKDGRQLIQIKLQIPGEATSRKEIKFPVKYYEDGSGAWEDTHPVVGLIRRKDREGFIQRMNEEHIPWQDLRESFTIEQRRRRIYISDSLGVLFSITLDEGTVDRWGAHTAFTEVEAEINEIRYTDAVPEERTYLENMQSEIFALITRNFPEIKVDQTPKYNKAMIALRASSPIPGIMWHLESHGEAYSAGAIVLAMVVVGVYARSRPKRRAVESVGVVAGG